LLVASCTDRKSLPVGKGTALRSLSQGKDLVETARKWREAIEKEARAGSASPLRDLYVGEYWAVVRRIHEQMLADVRVASAGLGMKSLDDVSCAYSATFAAGVRDSVLTLGSGRPDAIRAQWWAELETGRGAPWWRNTKGRVVVVAVSQSYQAAMAEDLRTAAQDGATVVVVSGSPQIGALQGESNVHHIRAHQWMRIVLGGSTPTVGIRFVEEVLRGGDAAPESFTAVKDRLKSEYESGGERLPVFDREEQTDEQVLEWIRNHRTGNARPTKSAYLRAFRDQGRKCEQSRFGLLFDRARPS
jgi:hypothetical protein